MSIPFYCIVRPIAGDPYVATRSGLKLRQEAAVTAYWTGRSLFTGDIPMQPWPAFLPPPAVIRAETVELAACLAELGWA